ncbi:hypothetical protein J7F04_39460 [Streptomyces sp. ISL-24]|nr:hypothetical protein [Streptomyces sp. ISL-24]MBT2423730.1 hypothetical protein [Streptomyces sp. ISL-24]
MTTKATTTPVTRPRVAPLGGFPAAAKCGRDHAEDPRATTAHHTTPARQ